MDENKVTTKKKSNLKNKKAVTKALSKTSTSKSKSSSVKKKKNITKVKDNKTVKKILIEPKETLDEKIKATKEIDGEKKDIEKKVSNKRPKKSISDNKKKKEESKQKKTASNEAKTKTTKGKTVKNKEKSKNKKEKETKTKLVLPKEWQAINNKKEQENDINSSYTLTGKLKNSFFEEVDEETYIIQKKKEKESIRKFLLIGLIVIVILLLAFNFLIKYNDNLRSKVISHGSYVIGDKVKLKDNSVWYVVEDSKDHNPNVKLLKENNIDINSDSKYTSEDKKKYNGENKSEYNPSDSQGVAKYLNDYKSELEKKIGSIEEISLLTSKEFVKIRERMNFGQQWNTANWLANSTIGNWWVISSPKEDSVYVVTSTGAYRITKANTANYVRPTIVISKENIEKINPSVEKK